MKKICFVTAARSEYGLLKWIMKDIDADKDFQLQLIVTGGHLLQSQGHTIDTIIDDGFDIDATVNSNLAISSPAKIASSMGRMAELFAPVFEKLSPDLLFVLGDRYELLPICNTAFVMRIPIAHISGGDITEGAIDDGIRNAVTMLATYHFPGTSDSAKNIERMRNSSKNIWAVGEPGLDAFTRTKMMSRKELAENLSLDESKKWVLMTYHAETNESLEYNLSAVKNCINVLKTHNDIQTIMTYANADFGGEEINKVLIQTAKENNLFRVIPSLGQIRYLSYMKQVSFVIGNSSSGIVEAPSLKIPVINIGNRQKGRYLCKNIIQTSAKQNDICKSIYLAKTFNKSIDDYNYWGDGNTTGKIIGVLHTLWK